MSPASRAVATSAARSSLLPSMDQFSAFAAPSTCMGPPLTESPGWCQVHERATCGGAQEGKQDRMPRRSRVTGRCSNGWRGRVHRHRAPARHQQGLRRASRSARRRTPAGRRHRLYERCPPSRNLAGHGQPDSRIRPSGQVTTATPFAPEELAIRKGHREPAVDPVARRASTHRRRKRRRLRAVSGGVASALDVAPFHDPRFLACCPWG